MKTLTTNTYPALVKRVRRELEELNLLVKNRTVEAYWRVGKFISEHLLENNARAAYGDKILEQLSRDVDRDVTTLSRSLKFYRTYPILAVRQGLNWNHYKSLITIKDETQRKKVEKETVHKNWDAEKLRKYLKAQRALEAAEEQGVSVIPQLISQKGALNIYQSITSDAVKLKRGEVLIDSGFNAWKVIRRSELKTNQLVKTRAGMSFTYKAYVEKIIDGDTLWVVIDLGFNDYTRQKLRLRAIDAPEIDTAAGKKARAYVCKALKGPGPILICTSKSDKYDRYLADVFYGPKKTFLNQKLLDARLATAYL